MRSRRILIVAGAVAVCALLALGLTHTIENRKAANALDEMYFAVVHPSYTETRIGFLQPVRSVTNIIPGVIDTYTDNYRGTYQGRYLNRGERLSISFHTKEQEIKISAWVYYGD